MLTHEEKKVVEMLAEVWNKYCELPEEHINEKDEFFNAIHVCQRTVLARAGRRDMKVLKAEQVLRVKREGAMRQYRFPEFVKVTDEMHERGMRFVNAARNDGCASVNVLYKEYLEEAMIPWLDEQEEIFLKSQINDDDVVGWHMFDFEGNWDFTEDEELAMKYKASCEASGFKDCVRPLYYKR